MLCMDNSKSWYPFNAVDDIMHCFPWPSASGNSPQGHPHVFESGGRPGRGRWLWKLVVLTVAQKGMK